MVSSLLEWLIWATARAIAHHVRGWSVSGIIVHMAFRLMQRSHFSFGWFSCSVKYIPSVLCTFICISGHLKSPVVQSCSLVKVKSQLFCSRPILPCCMKDNGQIIFRDSSPFGPSMSDMWHALMKCSLLVEMLVPLLFTSWLSIY